MKPLLLHRDRDFGMQPELPPRASLLAQDLELATLFDAMALGDEFLFRVAQRALLSSSRDLDTILYRQSVLKDCLRHPSVVRQIYDLAVEAIERQKKDHWWWSVTSRYPSAILSGSIDVLRMFLGRLRRLRQIAREHAASFESEGFRRLFATLEEELGEDYLAAVERHLAELELRQGAFLSAELGPGNATTRHVLRQARRGDRTWLARVLGRPPAKYSFRLHERDEAGAQILSEMRDRGIHRVANALGQSADHVLGFFVTLRTELAFYIGCLNLHARLAALGQPTCFPRPARLSARTLRFRELYDVCLALTTGRRVVGNSLELDGKSLAIVTGPNNGGKSTFLRSIGLAQLMMQCGMFVGAESFAGELCSGLFTHYRREEDPALKSGKLDEELSRMSELAEQLAADSTLLFNESFAATNEREGSEIASQIVRALLEKRCRIFFVTHLYEFARAWFAEKRSDAVFLRAERLPDGTRTFKILEGEPLETSYGEDLYRRIFGPDPGPPASTGSCPARAFGRKCSNRPPIRSEKGDDP
jgi:hypothetical protein